MGFPYFILSADLAIDPTIF